jgi:hypothetical protein
LRCRHLRHALEIRFIGFDASLCPTTLLAGGLGIILRLYKLGKRITWPAMQQESKILEMFNTRGGERNQVFPVRPTEGPLSIAVNHVCGRAQRAVEWSGGGSAGGLPLLRGVPCRGGAGPSRPFPTHLPISAHICASRRCWETWPIAGSGKCTVSHVDAG